MSVQRTRYKDTARDEASSENFKGSCFFCPSKYLWSKDCGISRYRSSVFCLAHLDLVTADDFIESYLSTGV